MSKAQNRYDCNIFGAEQGTIDKLLTKQCKLVKMVDIDLVWNIDFVILCIFTN